jgi:hypothetical protein
LYYVSAYIIIYIYIYIYRLVASEWNVNRATSRLYGSKTIDWRRPGLEQCEEGESTSMGRRRRSRRTGDLRGTIYCRARTRMLTTSSCGYWLISCPRRAALPVLCYYCVRYVNTVRISRGKFLRPVSPARIRARLPRGVQNVSPRPHLMGHNRCVIARAATAFRWVLFVRPPSRCCVASICTPLRSYVRRLSPLNRAKTVNRPYNYCTSTLWRRQIGKCLHRAYWLGCTINVFRQRTSKTWLVLRLPDVKTSVVEITLCSIERLLFSIARTASVVHVGRRT